MRGARRTAAAALVAGALATVGLAVPTVRADAGAEGTAAASAAASTAGGQARGEPSPASRAAEALLRAATDAPLTIVRDARGLAHLVGTTAGHPLPLPPGVTPGATAVTPEAAALAHLARVGPLFGLVDPTGELRPVPTPAGINSAPGDDQILRFQQLRSGLPVLGGDLAVVLDATGALKSVAGETLPSVLGEEHPGGVTAAQARETAQTLVAREHPEARRTALQAGPPERWYLDPGLIGVPAAQHMVAGPVWRVEVGDSGAVRDMVLVDSRTGKVPLRLDMITEAAVQAICDRANKPDRDPYGSDCRSGYARTGATTATGPHIDALEVNTAYANTERTSAYFKSTLNVDLTALLGVNTGDGKKLRSTVRFCPGTTLCSATNGTLFDNAFWNGRGMFYGTGWPNADDIVAHELTHGVTEKTARLLYLYQSGAINEAMSDIFGEFADQANKVDGSGLQTPWVVGEDAPVDVLPIRNMAYPTLTLPDPQPDRMTSPLYAVDMFFQDSGGVHDNSGVANKAAYLIATGTAGDGGSFNGQSFPGTGVTKAARLFYRALRTLSSGADYADLGAVLNQSCSDLIGQSGFATSTCDTVRRAVLATEMAKQPVAAAAPEAGFCPTGTRAYVFYDGFESFSSSRWALGGFWSVIGDYAKTGVRSLYGVEPDYATSSSVTLNTRLRIPRGVRVYLRFAHQYRLDSGPDLTGPYYDGARLEYREGSGSWKTMSYFPWLNGPSRTIEPIGSEYSYRAFGGDSRGYISSRMEVTRLVGKTVQLRWRLLSDRRVAVDGWTLDDVSLFACGTARPSDVRKVTVTPGSRKVTLKWATPLWGGTGGVTAYKISRTGKAAFKVGKSQRSWTFTKLTPRKSYRFTVRAVAKGGEGPARSVSARPKR